MTHIRLRAVFAALALALVIPFTSVALAGDPASYDVTDLRAATNKADYVIVVPSAFYKDVIPLANHRSKKGLKVAIVKLEDIYKTFGGAPSPEAIRDFVKYIVTGWQAPAVKYVLLVGDAGDAAKNAVIPAMKYKPEVVNPLAATPEIGTDNLYGCPDSAEKPAPTVAIGRFPADNSAELAVMINKTIAYEENRKPGTWRKRLTVIAGRGKFGDEADKRLEDLFTDVFNGYVPYLFDVNATYANPKSVYCSRPDKFGDTVLAKLNDGSLIFAYIGHGSETSFDTLEWKGTKFDILNEGKLSGVSIKTGSPVVISISCSTGNYDSEPNDCIGEKLLKLKGGPVAFIGSSRVSEPYANAVFAKELMASLLQGEKDRKTLGIAMQEAKGATLAEAADDLRKRIDEALAKQVQMFIKDPTGLMAGLRKNQMHLYNLLGDPALEIGYVPKHVKITAPAEAKPGDAVNVGISAEALKTGNGTLTIECERKAFVQPIEPVDPKDPKFIEKADKNYASANNKVVTSVAVVLKDGKCSATVQVPKEAAEGTYYLKVYCSSADAEEYGCAQIKIAAVK
jgi:hypothetical protein